MTDTQMTSQAFFEGLKALADSSFPKKCANCGRTYETPQDFLTQTESAAGHETGLKETLDYDDSTIVEVFRNCICGSTLMDAFEDRRDTSERGLRRREKFGQLLRKLESDGVDRETARQELLNVLRGRRSELLETKGYMVRQVKAGKETSG